MSRQTDTRRVLLPSAYARVNNWLVNCYSLDSVLTDIVKMLAEIK